MGLISEQERDIILQNLLEGFHDDDRIVAVLLAGSTSFGFNDRFSDIDLVIITEDDYFYESWRKWTDWFETTYTVVGSFGGALHERKQIYCYLLEGYLEVDLIFEARSAVSPRKQWQIAFDKTRQLEEEMNTLLQQEKGTRLDLYQENTGGIWYNITRGTITLKRGNIWRAYNETLQLMYKTAELAGLYYEQETKDFQSIDALPSEFVNKFRECIPAEITHTCVESAFREIISLYFHMTKKLDELLGTDIGKKTEKLMSGYPDRIRD